MITFTLLIHSTLLHLPQLCNLTLSSITDTILLLYMTCNSSNLVTLYTNRVTLHSILVTLTHDWYTLTVTYNIDTHEHEQ